TQNPWSRRRFLRVGAAVSGGAFIGLGFLGTPTFADAASAKVSKRTVDYQDKPKGQAHCANCAFFRPPSSCSNVEGPINPSGWCALFKAKT
ncbi:MAG TPA: hypothetical protein VM711_06755, partial [Sphingomicrobium sp.]|nr:hypothetical protein [Sphingomicrobium sp.]